MFAPAFLHLSHGVPQTGKKSLRSSQRMTRVPSSSNSFRILMIPHLLENNTDDWIWVVLSKINYCPEAVARHTYFIFKIILFVEEQMAGKVEVAIGKFSIWGQSFLPFLCQH